jgi:hypothetical protein
MDDRMDACGSAKEAALRAFARVFWARTAGRDQGATTTLAPKEPARRSDADIGRMDRLRTARLVNNAG